MNLNKALIAGNLTRDPELKSLPSGAKVCNFSLATNRVWKDAAGVRQESADYHNIVVFGAQAENSARYLHKGSTVFVEGRIQTRSWDGADGKKQYRTEIVADRVTFMNSRPANAGAPQSNTSGTAPVDNSPEQQQYDVIDYSGEDPNPDDIPF